MSDYVKSLLLTIPALLLAGLIVYLMQPFNQLQRLANLNLSLGTVPDLYVEVDKSVPGRCYVTDRRESAYRRGDRPAGRNSREFMRSEAELQQGELPHWALRCKTNPTILLVPINDVDDWAFPYCYQFVQAHDMESDLPRITWIQLFENRIYRGLYLKVELPFERRRWSGDRRRSCDLLAVTGTTMVGLNSRFEGEAELFPQLLADGRFPELTGPSLWVEWLRTRSSIEETLMVIRPLEPFRVSHLPLPVSLESEFFEITSQSIGTWDDDRFHGWKQAADSESVRLELLASATQLQRFHAEWKTYREAIVAALRVHCEYHRSSQALMGELSQRLDSQMNEVLVASRPGT